MTYQFLSHFQSLIRAFAWLAVIGLAVVIGKTVMDQITP